MNPSYSGDLNPGFSGSSPIFPNVSSNLPSVSRASGRGLSRPRLLKMRKQSGSYKSKPAGEIREEPGFNPFRPISGGAQPGLSGIGKNEASVLGATGSDLGDKGIYEGIKNLRIGSANEVLDGNLNGSDSSGFVFGRDQNQSSNLDVKLENLTINDNENVADGRSKISAHDKAKFGLRNSGNVDVTSIGKNVELGLSDELKKKLNVAKTRDFDNGTAGMDTSSASDRKKFELESNGKGGETSAESSENPLPDRIKNLSIKDHVTNNATSNRTSEKDSVTCGGRETARGDVGGERETIMSNGMGRKLNLESMAGKSSGHPDGACSTSQLFDKDMQAGKKSVKMFPLFVDAVPTEFNIRGGLQSKNTVGSRVPMGQPKVDIQTDLSSGGLAGGDGFGVPSTGRPEKPDVFSFPSKQDDVQSPFIEFKTPKQWGSLFSIQKPELGSKLKDSKVRKKRGKLKPPAKVHLCPAQDFVLRANGCQEVPEVLDSYSPMDTSPYQVTPSECQLSRETSVTSEESFSHGNQYASTGSQATLMNDAIDEDLAAATQSLEINGEDVICGETEQYSSEHFPEKGTSVENHQGEFISASETESFKSANEELDFINDGVVTSAENEVSSSKNIERQDSDLRTQFFSAVSSEDIGSSGFTFAASSAGQASTKRYHKKDSRAKVVRNSYSFTQNIKVPHASSPLVFSPLSADSFHMTPEGGKTLSESVPLHTFGAISDVLGQDSKQGSGLTSAACVVAQEACENWRLRGNQAYRNGDLSKAEECYTQGLNCVSRSETCRSCLRALMLCHSNRAATLMSLGRMRDALQDCQVAADIDPDFLKVQVRAANCHLALGEVKHALQYFNKCLQFVCVDRKIAVEASEGLQKAQKVSEFMQHSGELLQRKTPDDAGKALEVIAEALSICPFSEKLLEIKAKSLFMLRKYEDVIQLCEKTFDSAKNNTPSVHASPQLADLDDSELRKDSSFRLWRFCLIVKSYFYLGKLEEAIVSLEKQEELDSLTKSKTLESSIPLAAIVRELLQYKAAGNEAFQVGRYSEAIEHYTAALSCNVESRPFAAICFCNRAAAYKALGQITDAIADCSLAISLDGNYLKAISRRATLYEMIRDYGQAATDLQRMVVILTKQEEEKAKQPGTSDRSTNSANDLRQARLRLSTIEEAFRNDIPLDMYLILGIEPSASAAEIKKAYRKAALRHHPDKAGQVLARTDNADEGLWKEIGEGVRRDADRLFKMIGEAYAVLSDPTRRSQYDLEDEMRNALNKRNGTSTYRTRMDVKNYPFERTGSRRQWSEVGRSYGR